MLLICLVSYVLNSLAVDTRFFPARIISRNELSSAISRSEVVSAWGSTLLTNPIPIDTSPLALVALRVAARRVRATLGGGIIEFDDAATHVASARISYSEDGSSVSPVSVARSEAESGGPLSWEEHPVLGRMFWVKLRVRQGAPATASATTSSSTGTVHLTEENVWFTHTIELTSGVPDGDVNILAHTWDTNSTTMGVSGDKKDFIVTNNAGGAVHNSSDSENNMTTSPPPTTLRTLCYNVWNSNPPKWLFRDPRDRFRQYTLRMLHLGEAVQSAAAGIVAFQEVRYDSTLGGFDGGAGNVWGVDGGRREVNTDTTSSSPHSQLLATIAVEAQPPALLAHAVMPEIGRHVPYSYNMGFAVASLWFNKTAEFSQTEKYRTRNEGRWANVISAVGWEMYGGKVHPDEGDSDNLDHVVVAAAEVPLVDESGVTTSNTTTTEDEAKLTTAKRGRSPFLKPQAVGPANWTLIQESFLDHPHAQVCSFILKIVKAHCGGV